MDDPAGGPQADGKMPRWVKAFILVALLLVAGFVVLHLTGAAPKGH